MSRLDVDAKFYADLESVRVFFTTHKATFGNAALSFVNDIEKLCTEASVKGMSMTFYSSVRTRLSFLQSLMLAVVDTNGRDRFVHFSQILGIIQMMLNNLQFIEEDEASKPDPSQRIVQVPCIQTQEFVSGHLLPCFHKIFMTRGKGFGKRN